MLQFCFQTQSPLLTLLSLGNKAVLGKTKKDIAAAAAAAAVERLF